MNIIFHPDIMEYYFQCFGAMSFNSKQLLVSNIFNNTSSKIVVSKNYIEFLETYFSGTHSDLFKLFVKSIVGNGQKSESVITPAFKNIENELANLHTASSGDITIILSKSPIRHMGCNLDCVGNFDLFDSNKTHHLIVNLCARNEVSYRHFDFQNDSEIKSFFDSMFLIPKRIVGAFIFGRYCNFSGHNLFETLKRRSPKVRVYTNNPKRYPQEIDHKIKEAKSLFGKTCNIFSTSQAALIHERKLLVDKLIIEVDDDFDKLSVSNQTWKIDISYSDSLFKSILSKTPKFKLEK